MEKDGIPRWETKYFKCLNNEFILRIPVDSLLCTAGIRDAARFAHCANTQGVGGQKMRPTVGQVGGWGLWSRAFTWEQAVTWYFWLKLHAQRALLSFIRLKFGVWKGETQTPLCLDDGFECAVLECCCSVSCITGRSLQCFCFWNLQVPQHRCVSVRFIMYHVVLHVLFAFVRHC